MSCAGDEDGESFVLPALPKSGPVVVLMKRRGGGMYSASTTKQKIATTARGMREFGDGKKSRGRSTREKAGSFGVGLGWVGEGWWL